MLLYKRFTESPHPFHHMRIQGDRAGYELGGGPSPEHNHASTLFLDFPASRTIKNKCMLITSHLVYGILL